MRSSASADFIIYDYWNNGRHFEDGWGADRYEYNLFKNIVGDSSANTLIAGEPLKADMKGLGGVDTLVGNVQDDSLDGGSGADVMAGGQGDDTYIVDDPGDVVTELPGGGIDTVQSSVSFVAVEVEKLLLVGSANINGTGDAVDNTITGNSGNNWLAGGGGNDTLIGGAGNDQLVGGSGDDTLIGGAGDDGLNGGADADTATYAAAGARVMVSLAVAGPQDTGGAGIDTLSGIENLIGSAFDDALTGDGGANALYGGAGWDKLVGGAGDDHLEGGAGGDTLEGGAGNDLLDGGADSSSDTASYSTATAGVTVNLAVAGPQDTIGAGVDTLVGIGSLIGSAFADSLTGDARNNTLSGLDGDDVLNGGGGVDVLGGGAGNDRLDGGSGTDRLEGGAGNDLIDGGDPGIYYSAPDIASYSTATAGVTVSLAVAGPQDTVGAGIDTLVRIGDLIGSAFADSLTGDAGSNSLSGGSGDDILDGGAGKDSLNGGAGNDIYYVDDVADSVNESGNQGHDVVYSYVSNDLGSNVEDLWLLETTASPETTAIYGTGNDLDNRIFGNSAANQLFGGAGGDDYLDGKAGADSMSGGVGNDTYIVDDAGDIVAEGNNGGIDIVRTAVGFVLGSFVENLTLTGSASISGTGNELANTILGNIGNNFLDGGLGADTMRGRAGDDRYRVDEAGDVVAEGVNQGTDKVLSLLSFVLANNIENLTLTGIANINGTGNGLANAILGNTGDNILDGGLGADTMKGGLGNDTYIVDNAGDAVIEYASQGTDTVQSKVSFVLASNIENLTLTGTANINGTGNDLVNTILGNVGNNILDGGAGADAMLGGLGNDSYVVDKAGDVITEVANQGTDIVTASVSYLLANNVEKLTLAGSTNINGTGNGLANTILGNTGNNVLDGKAGADTLKGGAGNDTYVVDNAGDVVTEAVNQGTDTVRASVTYTLANNIEHLTLTGSGDIKGTGNGMANRVAGNASDNVINGLLGNDVLSGGGGQDSFVFDTSLASNIDTVADFNAADDTMWLDRSVFTALTTLGSLAAGAFQLGVAATQADDRVIYNAATGNLYYDRDGTGAAAQVQFAHLTGNPTLTHADFLIVA